MNDVLRVLQFIMDKKKCYCGVNHEQEINKKKKKEIPQMDDIQQKLFPLLSFV